ncbi:acetyl-CoA acetyltransferase [Catenuloplanes atrovinosus]|uniref:Acetyl-CoA C-acetyltransferase n=1 Tax=Catenuloplanes atrovinosus TaxID=137266 RepID=A0AAE3YQD0_9ACTN|nr:acetyl-CoA acetyltransferase [Catenuloplanes atrovinosus]MDR7276691.1 acetyl-CoA C-acetyltransferase [Catenuloplanes atrovinosus]
MIDDRTPVIIGVGEASERLDDPGYRRMSPVDLAAAAAAEALAGGVHVDVVAAVRQFEISTPWSHAPLGRADNPPRAVAARLGQSPARAILDVTGGQAPQRLVTELAGEIAAGRADTALVCGAEAISTVARFAGADDRPDFTEHVGGQLEDRGYGLDGLMPPRLAAHGLLDPPGQYALFEHARRARLGLSEAAYAAAMGALFAPFTRVAAGHPHAAAPTVRTAAELVTPTPANRLVADPYPRYLVSRDKVNQGAAVLLASVAAARRLGVPPDRWVFLHGHADLREKPVLERPDLSAYPAAVAAVRHALDVAGLALGDVDVLDLYSCFPIAVFAVCDGLGLAADDPRGLTVTGGLPFFGGPGNDYALHAIAETVRRVRRAPGTYGLVGANGGFLSKYSVGVYSAVPAPWRPGDGAAIQAALDRVPPVEVCDDPAGPAVVETYTRKPGQDAVVVGRTADGRRFVASCAAGGDLLGARGTVDGVAFSRDTSRPPAA